MRRSYPRTILLASFAAFALAGCGHSIVGSAPPHFSGKRTMAFQNGTETLIVHKDGTYQQVVTTRSHKSITNKNHWTFGQRPPRSTDNEPWIVLNKSLVAWEWCDKPAKASYANLLIPTSSFGPPAPFVYATDIAWRSPNGASTEAAKSNKLLMVDFYTDWCGWCKKMDADVYTDQRVIKAAAGFVAVRVNAEGDGRQLAHRYDVHGYPTILFLRSDGQEVQRITGYESAEQFAADLTQIAASNR